MKSKILVSLIVLGACAAFLVSGYNGLVSLDQSVKGQWAQIESQYQRRFDLIPNLTETAKGYMAHEKSIFTELANARKGYVSATNPSAKIAAAGTLDRALVNFLAIAENYPDLKANQTMLALMDELAGTENRIAVERMRYNETVQTYNSRIKRFPTVMIAKASGFDEKPFIQSDEGAEKAPEVKF